jgi:hypothetical protein
VLKSNTFSTSSLVDVSPSLKFHIKSNWLSDVLMYSTIIPSQPGVRMVSKEGIGLDISTKRVSV